MVSSVFVNEKKRFLNPATAFLPDAQKTLFFIITRNGVGFQGKSSRRAI
jgi:hypothetical protein